MPVAAACVLQTLYERACDYLELDRRVEVLNARFTVLQGMLDMMRDHITTSHRCACSLCTESSISRRAASNISGGVVQSPQQTSVQVKSSRGSGFEQQKILVGLLDGCASTVLWHGHDAVAECRLACGSLHMCW